MSVEGRRENPTAIRGTWSDIERRARYLYLYGDDDTAEWELAEAVLVLLTVERERVGRALAALGAL